MNDNQKLALILYFAGITLALISIYLILTNQYITCYVLEQNLDAGHNKDLLYNISNESVDITTEIKNDLFITKTCFKTKEYLEDYISSVKSSSLSSPSESIFNFSSMAFNLS